jgi:hypothetical protein
MIVIQMNHNPSQKRLKEHESCAKNMLLHFHTKMKTKKENDNAEYHWNQHQNPKKSKKKSKKNQNGDHGCKIFAIDVIQESKMR